MAARAPDTAIKTHNATARSAKSQPMNGRIMSTLNMTARIVSGNVKLNASLDSCAVNGPRSRNTAKTIAEGTQPKIAPKWAIVAHWRSSEGVSGNAEVLEPSKRAFSDGFVWRDVTIIPCLAKCGLSYHSDHHLADEADSPTNV